MTHHPITELLTIMARLRTPGTGCPWDLAQTFATIAPYTIEEAYEVADAIHREDLGDLQDELGDLLLQVVYHARIASEQNAFTFEDVVRSVTAKMIARHPHVFADVSANAAEDVNVLWEDQKAQERSQKAGASRESPPSVLDGIALALPALMRAQKMQRRAARIGFDWPSTKEVMEKIEEELAEMKEALQADNEAHIREEFGDLLFAFVNLGRKLDIDVEDCLRTTNDKFERRFKGMEHALRKAYDDPAKATLDQMEELWVAEKMKERV